MIDTGIKHTAQIYVDIALHWYQKAVNPGNADAQYMLGLMYAAGIGFELDLEKAVQLWEAAAAQGHADTIINIIARM